MRTLIRPAGAVAVLAVLSVLPTACADDARSPAAAGTTSEATPVTVVESSVPAELDSGLTTKLGEVMDRFGVPGAVVALEDPDVGSWVATAGVSDVESGEEMTTTLQWPIRSITKSFVVTVLWQLVQEGRVALTDTVDRWVPGIPNGDRITLGQLADMTSGVPDYTGEAFVEDFTADPTAPFTRAQLLDYVRRGEPSAAPGAERRYINASTVLLGEVIEQVEQRPFAEVLQERIAGPLSLAGTAYPNEVDGFTAEHPTGYQPDDDGLSAPPTNFTVFDTAGAMTSDLADLMAWGPALAEGRLLEAGSQEQRLEGSPLLEGPEYDAYASGIGEIAGWWGHTGEGFGYTTLVMHEPGRGATAVVLMNVSNLDEHAPTVLFREIAGLLEG